MQSLLVACEKYLEEFYLSHRSRLWENDIMMREWILAIDCRMTKYLFMLGVAAEEAHIGKNHGLWIVFPNSLESQFVAAGR